MRTEAPRYHSCEDYDGECSYWGWHDEVEPLAPWERELLHPRNVAGEAAQAAVTRLAEAKEEGQNNFILGMLYRDALAALEAFRVELDR